VGCISWRLVSLPQHILFHSAREEEHCVQPSRGVCPRRAAQSSSVKLEMFMPQPACHPQRPVHPPASSRLVAGGSASAAHGCGAPRGCGRAPPERGEAKSAALLGRGRTDGACGDTPLSGWPRRWSSRPCGTAWAARRLCGERARGHRSAPGLCTRVVPGHPQAAPPGPRLASRPLRRIQRTAATVASTAAGGWVAASRWDGSTHTRRRTTPAGPGQRRTQRCCAR
jgi:hypothetical protein